MFYQEIREESVRVEVQRRHHYQVSQNLVSNISRDLHCGGQYSFDESSS